MRNYIDPQAMLALNPLPVVHDSHWEALISARHANSPTHATELGQSASAAWAITLLREAKAGLTSSGIDTIWSRVREQCVPHGQELISAIDFAGQAPWTAPMPAEGGTGC